MFTSIGVLRLVVCCLLLSQCCWAASKSKPLERTLYKLASAMLQAHPELKEGRRTKVARESLIEEFRRLEADKITAAVARRLRRRKADYSSFKWETILKKFERANFEGAKCSFLLKKAKLQKMNREEHYVVTRLMEGYYAEGIARREELSKRRLRAIGKAYSKYLKLHKSEPQSLRDFVSDLKLTEGVNPLTGKKDQWVFVGGGPEPMLGANKFRVVVYSPFLVGRSEKSRWVVYKGGRTAEWKGQTVLKKHAAMRVANEQYFAQKDAERRARVAVKVKKPKRLKITIRELW